MDIHIVEPRSQKVYGLSFLAKFLQSVAAHYIQGNLRYGPPHAGRMYFSRLQKEAAAYGKTGNAEHLLNVAVYCLLEMIAPQHPRHHHNGLVDSVTRKEYGA